MQQRELPEGWDKNLPTFPADAKGMATRESSGKVLNAIAKNVPWLVGGSADLAGSDRTRLKFDGAGDFQAGSYGGRNLHFGVREHGMAAALNGMAVSKIRPFGGTFFNFSDYMRPSIRLAALMEIPTIFVFTHDSIGLGEDGPTHQPIEQLASLRAMPGLMLMRPGDANEVVEAWKVIMQLKHEPAALVLQPAGRAHLRPHEIWRCVRRRQRRVHPGRCSRRQAGSHPDGHRQRSFAVRQRLRATEDRRHESPRGQHAFVGSL